MFCPIRENSSIMFLGCCAKWCISGISLKPTNYALSLHDLEFGGAFSYQGTVKIDVEIRKSTAEVVLNANQLRVHDAEVIVELNKSKIVFLRSDP